MKLKRIFLLLYICVFIYTAFSSVSFAEDNINAVISDASVFLIESNETIPEPYCIVYSTPDLSVKYIVCFSDAPFYFNRDNKLTTNGLSVIRANYSANTLRFNSYSFSIASVSLSDINVMYVNHNIMNYDRTEIIFPATGDFIDLPGSETSEPGDIGDYSYNNDSVEAEKGGVITKILDPFFLFVNWLFGWLPDLSTDTDTNWLAELARLARSAFWFLPKDVIISCFVCIQAWMSIHLVYAILQFIVRLFTLRI